MTDAINTNNRVKTPVQGPENRAQKPVSGEAGKAASSPASDVVELSSEQMLAQMRQLPEVDSSRVEAIKSAIANGEYKPNSEAIAQKFAELEKLLP
jgi:negative regulator of flagellin synthesis FlgM